MSKPGWIWAFLFGVIWVGTTAAQELSMKMDNPSGQAKKWTRFADQLFVLHGKQIKAFDTRSEKEQGGYGGEMWGDARYVETAYFNKANGNLLSRIRTIDGENGNFHTLEVNIYDDQGKVVRDYSASYLPGYRNAPYQTLINFHSYSDGLHAFRQFDASDRVIYEACKGEYFGEKIDIRLEDFEIPDLADDIKDMVKREAYRSCFSGLPKTVGRYLNPDNEVIGQSGARSHAGEDTIEARISALDQYLQNSPRDSGALVKRGDLYLQAHHFDKAIADYTSALKANDKLDTAWFGRGMARGRAGDVEGGIADLTVYIQRNPNDSRAYTKRGVRYIWVGKLNQAESDMRKAIALNPKNSEAHDDLGVILSNKKEFNEAIKHFQSAVRYDPSYFKAYHNMAVAYYVLGENARALKEVDNCIALVPENREALVLKGTLLKAMGRSEEAGKYLDLAESAPKTNWSEQFSIQ